MAYCSQADLEERFGKLELAQLTDETAAQSAVASEIAAACDEATSLIDGYIAAKYTLPLTSVPSILKKWACDIARKFLWKDRAGPTAVVTLNYEAAVAGLRDIAKGSMTLPDATGVVLPGASSAIAVTTSTAVFSDDILGLM